MAAVIIRPSKISSLQKVAFSGMAIKQKHYVQKAQAHHIASIVHSRKIAC